MPGPEPHADPRPQQWKEPDSNTTEMLESPHRQFKAMTVTTLKALLEKVDDTQDPLSRNMETIRIQWKCQQLKQRQK